MKIVLKKYGQNINFSDRARKDLENLGVIFENLVYNDKKFRTHPGFVAFVENITPWEEEADFEFSEVMFRIEEIPDTSLDNFEIIEDICGQEYICFFNKKTKKRKGR